MATRWYLPTRSSGASAVTTAVGWSGTAWDLATYHLTGGGGWVVTHNPAGLLNHRATRWPSFRWNPPPPYALHSTGGGGGESYLYCYGWVRVLMPGGGSGSGGLVEVAALEGPSAAQLGLEEAYADAFKEYPTLTVSTHRQHWRRSGLVAHPDRGAVFLMSRVSLDWPTTTPWMPGLLRELEVGWGVWRLVRERMEWEVVARLDMQEFERLTGVRQPLHHDQRCRRFIRFRDAYALRDLVCCHLVHKPYDVALEKGADAQDGLSAMWVLGFNLDTETGVRALNQPACKIFFVLNGCAAFDAMHAWPTAGTLITRSN